MGSECGIDSMNKSVGSCGSSCLKVPGDRRRRNAAASLMVESKYFLHCTQIFSRHKLELETEVREDFIIMEPVSKDS